MLQHDQRIETHRRCSKAQRACQRFQIAGTRHPIPLERGPGTLGAQTNLTNVRRDLVGNQPLTVRVARRCSLTIAAACAALASTAQTPPSPRYPTRPPPALRLRATADHRPLSGPERRREHCSDRRCRSALPRRLWRCGRAPHKPALPHVGPLPPLYPHRQLVRALPQWTAGQTAHPERKGMARHPQRHRPLQRHHHPRHLRHRHRLRRPLRLRPRLSRLRQAASASPMRRTSPANSSALFSFPPSLTRTRTTTASPANPSSTASATLSCRSSGPRETTARA